jgi:methylenetetrahydrofolate dehydrogenase (NADP+) / methenyltetrahydrofolate cyclohydrolase
MTARIIDGKAVAAALRAKIANDIAAAKISPGLAVVLVGDDPASAVYVRTKDKAARDVGLDVRTIRLPASSAQTDLLDVIQALNADATVDGILVQMPLPAHLDARTIISAIDPLKDVDGFHPTNVGLLTDGRPRLAPCTPVGVMRLLTSVDAPIRGADAVVVGRSTIVGRPMAALLLLADATVTVAHSKTRDLSNLCRGADILVVAAGRPKLVSADWIKPGATVIDVGINRLPDGKLVGDLDFEACSQVAGAITPVPGGVGPMTVACLLENTLTAARLRRSSTGF